ncbi:hypothetical protein Tco_1308327 [Tanacetum coccineum]
MAAPVISILSDTSDEVWVLMPTRDSLWCFNPALHPNIPEVPFFQLTLNSYTEVGTVYSQSLTPGVLDLVNYSPSSDSDPSEDSLPLAPDLLLVSPFLCSDDTEMDDESEPAEQRHVSSSHDTLAPLSEFPLALVVAPPRIRRHRHSSPDSSPSSAPSDYSLSGHTPPMSAPLSTPYPPTTSESSLGSSSKRSLDSSSHSFRPSRKRCRSPTASVPSPTYVSRSIAPTSTDLLPPRKRFRDSYSPEDSGEEHMEVDTADAKAVVDIGISEGVIAHPEDGVGMRFEIAASDVREDDEEFEVEASAANTR